MYRQRLGIGTLMIIGLAACSVGDGARGSFGEGEPAGPMAAEGGDTDGEAEGGDEDDPDGTEGGGETDGGEPDQNDDAAEYIEEARKNFPTYLDLHTKVIQRTCTPNENVCHNNKEYPDLRTPQGVLDRLGQPCNLNELYADPEAVYNGCEPPGDIVRFTAGGNVGFTTEVGWIEIADDGMGGGTAIIHIKDAVPAGMASTTYESVAVERMVAGQSQMVGTIDLAVSYAAGARSIQVNATENWALHQSLLEAEITPGDPNRDDVYGASTDESMHELLPGDPWNSYLLQRLQGNVPGSPMPLANQPLSASEVIAVACWIEGADVPEGAGVDSVIDYDNCSYAEEFATPPEGGGATLSGHVQPILDQYCAVAGCHAGDIVAEDLDLSAGRSRASLVEVMARQNPNVPLVTPLNPTNSYLITKLTSAGQSGQQMPLNAPALGESELDIIRTWIIQGAPDN